MIKVVAFDLFGTIFDPTECTTEDKREYIRQVRRPEWAPLQLPESWRRLKAFEDSREQLINLRKEGYKVVTCSNFPVDMIVELSNLNDLRWDFIIPLELLKVYKPNLKTYSSIYELLNVLPEQVLMVTGNEGSPDLDHAPKVGVNSLKIRNDRLDMHEVLEYCKRHN